MAVPLSWINPNDTQMGLDRAACGRCWRLPVLVGPQPVAVSLGLQQATRPQRRRQQRARRPIVPLATAQMLGGAAGSTRGER